MSTGCIVVSGADRVSRRQAGFSHSSRHAFLICDVPESAEQWTALVRTATITGAAIAIELEDPQSAAQVSRWIQRHERIAWVLLCSVEVPVSALPQRPWRTIRIDPRYASSQDWHDALGVDPPRGHRLTPEQLAQLEHAFVGLDRDVDAAIRRLAAGRLDGLALRTRPTRGRRDIVLTKPIAAQLAELQARYELRNEVYEAWGFDPAPSTGLVALFAGPSGTGKTLAAEIVAGELGLDLYRIKLSAVVSKYIGETEKNLEEIFEAASAANMVLFFDEADALFGKRSEVSDARDRYANIEVSYLLQRIERYDGFVILATNFANNIDAAFLRRIQLSIFFPMPEPPEREKIWRLCIPSRAPQHDLDLHYLAREFELSGGAIRNACLTAAFLAAGREVPISMDLLLIGVEREYRKIGRLWSDPSPSNAVDAQGAADHD